MCGFSSNVFLISSPKCGLARGHVLMSDLYIPLPISNSRSAVHLQGTWIPGGHQEISISKSCCFSQTEAKPHTGLESAPGPRDSCGHHGRGDLRPESEAWDCLLWIVFSPGQVFNFLSLCLPVYQKDISIRWPKGFPPWFHTLQILEFVPRLFRHLTPSITLVYGNTSPRSPPKLPQMEKTLKHPWKSGGRPNWPATIIKFLKALC